MSLSAAVAAARQRCYRRRPNALTLRALSSWLAWWSTSSAPPSTVGLPQSSSLAWWSTSTPSQCRYSSASSFKERVSLSIHLFASYLACCKGGVYPSNSSLAGGDCRCIAVGMEVGENIMLKPEDLVFWWGDLQGVRLVNSGVYA